MATIKGKASNAPEDTGTQQARGRKATQPAAQLPELDKPAPFVPRLKDVTEVAPITSQGGLLSTTAKRPASSLRTWREQDCRIR